MSRKGKNIIPDDEVLLVIGGNKFGIRWRNCYLGAFRLQIINNKVMLELRYKGSSMFVECYKNPYRQALGVFSGHEDWVDTQWRTLYEWNKQGKIAGRDYLMYESGLVEKRR